MGIMYVFMHLYLLLLLCVYGAMFISAVIRVFAIRRRAA